MVYMKNHTVSKSLAQRRIGVGVEIRTHPIAEKRSKMASQYFTGFHFFIV